MRETTTTWADTASDIEIVQRFMDLLRKPRSDAAFKAGIKLIGKRLEVIAISGVGERLPSQRRAVPQTQTARPTP